MEEQLDAIKKAEDRVGEIKKELKRRQAELERKLRFKREGVEEEREELNKLVAQNERETAQVEGENVNDGADATRAEKKAAKERERQLAALERDRATLRQKLEGLDAELEAIGGVITAVEAKRLILKKLYDLINNELARYLNAEKRTTIAVFENLWDKYAVSARAIEGERAATMRELNDYLTKLGYSMEEFVTA
jgi:type I restriction enzyme M protein